MPRYVALLKGVNVGGNNRVPMAYWKALLSTVGCTDIETLLNSGNAVVTSSERSAIVSGNDLSTLATDASRLLVAFTQERKGLEDVQAIKPLLAGQERLHIGVDAAYLWCPDTIRDSKAGAALLGRHGRNITTRNWATVLKIVGLVT